MLATPGAADRPQLGQGQGAGMAVDVVDGAGDAESKRAEQGGPAPSGEDPSFVDEGRTSSTHARGGTPLLLERWPLVVAVAGLVLLAAAAIDLTVDDAGSQTMILVVAGVLLVVVPLVRDRLAPVSPGTSGLRFELSREIADRGAGATARLIDHSASGLAIAAETYGRVHATKVVGDDATARAIRARLTDDLVDEASASARVHKYDADEVRQLFRDGSPVVRVLVLGLMLGDSSLASVDTLRSAISESRSGNEQYQGLVLANRLRHRLTPSARQSLTERIRNDAAIWRSTDRRAQARAFVGDALADASAARFATPDS
jgi:hypothetical protein